MATTLEPPMPAPADAPKTTLLIDGREVTVAKGTNILEAARAVGTDISYFCYHPGLSSPAVCRQCLVEVKGQPKLIPSCYTPVADKMEVITNNKRVLDARAQMLEFTLVNHPIDCPICDKAGECTLQDLYHAHDHQHSRVDVEKVEKPKMVDLGPTILLDAERCILCTRCVRVCDEVAGVHQLEITERGNHSELNVAPGRHLDNPYSINTVDVCPVGALTSKDFRFTMRAWELYTTDSVCPGCATGCNVEVHHAQNEAWRLIPRFNAEVNTYWMCDEGRLTYKDLSDRNRVVGASLQGDPAPLDQAASFAAQRIAAARQAGKLGVVFGAQASNEDLWLLGRIGIDTLGANHVFIGGKAPVPARADKILRDADVNPNTAGAKLFSRTKKGDTAGDAAALQAALQSGKIQALWVIGEDVNLPAALVEKLGALDLIVQATHHNALTEVARVVLPAAAWAEVDGTITNRQGKVQRWRKALDPKGGSRPHWDLILTIARKLDIALDLIGLNVKPDRKVNARDVFFKMKAEAPEMAAVEWGKPAPLVQLRFANSRG